MRIAETQLRRIISEALLAEQVFGAQAFVYHGSNAPPSEFLPLIFEDKFDPGKVSGAMYGKGLYTVYSSSPETQTMKGFYGNWIYKLKVNLREFICFDPPVAQKVYGKPLTPVEQAKALRLDARIVKNLEHIEKNIPADGTFTSGAALEASKILRGNVKGIVYTGRQDGPVALIYDVSAVTPTSYRSMYDNPAGWTLIDRKMIKSFIAARVNKPEWSPGKYDEPLMRFKRGGTYVGALVLSSINRIRTLPLDFTIKGNLTLADLDEEYEPLDLPEGLRVEGNLVIDALNIKELPRGLVLGGDLEISYSEITSLPIGLHVPGSLILVRSRKLKSLPENLYVGERIVVTGMTLALPKKLTIEGSPQLFAQNLPLIKDSDNALWRQYIERMIENDPAEYEKLKEKYAQGREAKRMSTMS